MKRVCLLNGKGLAASAVLVSSAWFAVSAVAGPLVEVSDKPLYALQVNAKPSLTLALSVEFPTVGAQYLSTSYDQNRQYIGYYNPDLCYSYNNGGAASNRYFTPNTQLSVNHGCAGRGFSGNFLNWATGSAIDILRYSLTGGDRVIDTPTTTVLQRAVVPTNFYNAGNFPQRSITAAQAAQAVPDNLRYLPASAAMYTGSIYINNCLDRVYFHSTSGGSCGIVSSNRLGSRLSSDPFFYARVEVCTRNPDGSLQDVREVGESGVSLCTQFPSGNYKPVGKLYTYSDAMRVAAFGYPLQSGDNGFYKGVLRAPMKFVGPNAYNSDYEYVGTNPRREWDPNTGVFINDPEGAGSSFNSSGVINYLNRFGRTGTPGNYISYDHVNQLYYEALRYLQGLRPTPAAVNSTMVNASTLDGFPIYTTWSDPHPAVTKLGSTGDYSCYRNHIVVIGDKNTHVDNMVPGYGRTPGGDSQNEPNFYHWTDIAGGFEGNSSRGYTDGEGLLRTTTGNPNPYSGKASLASQSTGSGNKSNYSLVGMAYWANTHDIRGNQWTTWVNTSGSGDPRRPGMRVTSYFIDVNEVNGSATVAQRQSVNQYFYAAKYGGFDARRSLGGNPFTSDGTTFTNALWQRGIGTSIQNELFPQTYFLASDAESVLQAFDNIFESIVDKSYSLAGVSSSGGYSNTIGHGDVLFQGSFNGTNWTGDVTASTVTVTNVGGKKEVTYPVITGWSPAEALNNRNLISDPRHIVIGQRRGGSYTAADFQWSRLTSDQKSAITNGHSAGPGPHIVDFLRGERSREGSSMRVRGGLLGDISNAGVAYKGAPAGVSYDDDYRTFFDSYKNRTPVVYVGANDGMLHAFNADMSADAANNAREIFAYIPSFVVDNLYLLTQTTYDHRSYVDATPAVAEAKINGSWRTVLVGGAGAGGQGVYALDVTDPNAFNVSSMLWEFTDQDDASMGNVLSAPQIVRIASRSSAADPVIEYRWYALVAGGVNNEAEDGHAAPSGSGPALFILDLSKPSGDKWTLGTNYFKVALDPLPGKDQGLVNFTAVVNNKSRLQAIYAGDLSGQLWRIRPGTLLRDGSGPAISPFLLFRTGYSKQITSAPAVSTYGDMTILSFGTGMYLGEDDTKPPYDTQSIFTILDADEFVNLGVISEATPKGGSSFGVNVPFSWGPPSVATPTGPSVRSGWFVNLPGSGTRGERVVHGSSIRSGTVVTNSILPSVGGCDLGSSRQYFMNLLQGTGEFIEIDGQMLGDVVFVDLGANIVIDPSTGNPVIGSDSQSAAGGTGGVVSPDRDPISSGREKSILDWREIQNFEQLRNELSATP